MRVLLILLLMTVNAFAEDVPLKITERTEKDGQTRYDIQSGDFTYHFWGKKQIQDFAEQTDISDDEKTKLMREIVKSQLKTKHIDDLVNDLKNAPKVFTTTKEVFIVEEKI